MERLELEPDTLTQSLSLSLMTRIQQQQQKIGYFLVVTSRKLLSRSILLPILMSQCCRIVVIKLNV